MATGDLLSSALTTDLQQPRSTSALDATQLPTTRAAATDPVGFTLPTAPQDQVFDLRSFAGKTVKGSFNTTSITADYNNTVGLYKIEDALGSVIDPSNNQSYKPGDAGYALAAVRRSTVDGASFSARAGAVTAELKGGAVYAPYLISNNTVASVVGGGNAPVFFNFTAANPGGLDHFVVSADGRIGVEDIVGGGDGDFNDAIFSARFEDAMKIDLPAPPQEQVFDLRTYTGKVRTLITTTTITADYNNTVGLYKIEDAIGTVIDPSDNKSYKPGDAGYIAAMVRRSQTDGITFSARAGDVTAELNGGSLYSTYLISNGTPAAALAGTNPVFSNFTAVNPGGLDHFKTNADGRIGVEDIVGGGDADYNDALFSVRFETSTPTPPPTPTPFVLPDAPEDQVFDLRQQAGKVRTLINTTTITADYNNTVGLYKIEDSIGTVIDPIDNKSYKPGDPGYNLAAVRNSQTQGISFGARAGNVVSELNGGNVYAPYLISNNTVASVLGGSNAPIFTNFVASNPGGFDHFTSQGVSQFGVEDIVGGGDRDFNDALVEVKFDIPVATV